MGEEVGAKKESQNGGWEEIGGNMDFWHPQEEGDELVGVIVGEVDGKYGKQHIIECSADKKDYLTPSHAVLQNRLSRCRVGDVVRLVYKGVIPDSRTRLYAVFKRGGEVVGS